MNFLIDAQLPRRLAAGLIKAGHGALHTLDLPNGNRTTDAEVIRIAAQEKRTVITKDTDFVNSFHLKHQPEKLLLIATGNISNIELEALLLSNLDAIVAAFQSSDLIELSRTALTIHD